MKSRLLKTMIVGVAFVALFAIMVGAAVAAPATVTITGAVIGTGGGGSNAWSLPVSGATIAVQDAAQTATTVADGTYALILPFAPLDYVGKAITATHPWYVSGRKLLGGDAFQVRTFLLTVKGTKFVVTVKSGSKKVKGAKVACFGKSATTNKSGVATLSGLGLKPQTKYTVKITKSGYDTSKFKIGSKPGATVKITKNIKRK
jgi:protein-S-isoprenylcysteine O-methyltransferase Ste14